MEIAKEGIAQQSQLLLESLPGILPSPFSAPYLFASHWPESGHVATPGKGVWEM